MPLLVFHYNLTLVMLRAHSMPALLSFCWFFCFLWLGTACSTYCSRWFKFFLLFLLLALDLWLDLLQNNIVLRVFLYSIPQAFLVFLATCLPYVVKKLCATWVILFQHAASILTGWLPFFHCCLLRVLNTVLRAFSGISALSPIQVLVSLQSHKAFTEGSCLSFFIQLKMRALWNYDRFT